MEGKAIVAVLHSLLSSFVDCILNDRVTTTNFPLLSLAIALSVTT